MTQANTAPYIFVSCADEDLKRVIPLAAALQKNGINLWHDCTLKRDLTAADVISQKIDGSAGVLIFLSKAALGSQDVRRVVTYCINLNKPIKAVYLENVTLTPGMRLQLCLVPAVERGDYADSADLIKLLCSDSLVSSCKNNFAVRPAATLDAGLKSCRPWDIVEFGSYSQIDPAPTPIKWIVLNNSNGRILLLSQYVLAFKPFHHHGFKDAAWSDCSLRGWLNTSFLQTAFTRLEASLILRQPVIRQSISSKESLNSTDGVRLLTAEELQTYGRERLLGVEAVPFALPPETRGDNLHYHRSWIVLDDFIDGDGKNCCLRVVDDSDDTLETSALVTPFFDEGVRPVITICVEDVL